MPAMPFSSANVSPKKNMAKSFAHFSAPDTRPSCIEVACTSHLHLHPCTLLPAVCLGPQFGIIVQTPQLPMAYGAEWDQGE